VYLLLLAGSVANAIASIIDDPSSILSLLGSALPAVSIFFMNYALNAVFIGIPVGMLRIGPLALYQIYRLLFKEKSLTRRQIVEGPLAEEAVNYGDVLPGILYFAALSLTYWVIAPILLCIMALVFCGLYISWKYMVLYVYVPKFESGGLFW
jgi:hypothetical protein